MNAFDAIKRAASASGKSLRGVSLSLGKSPNYIANNASRGSDPGTGNAAAMLKVCGYTLCAVPDPDVPGSAIVIDPAETRGE